MSQNSETLLIHIPQMNNLIIIHVKIQKCGVRDRSAISDFHWQILKSRQIIFEIPEILVGKSDRDRSLLYIITFKNNFITGTLEESLKRYDIKILEHKEPVPIALFKFCFQYTIAVRLSPEWNKVAYRYLVKEKYFLFKNQPLEAVEIEIVEKDDNNLLMFVEAFHVRLPSPKLTDFEVSSIKLKQLRAKTIDTIDLPNITIYKLPNMLRGTAISLHNKIMPSCPLKSYADIRRHWKNMYGYRLPVNEKGIYYVTVQIQLGAQIDEKLYPLVCTRLNPIQKIRTSSAKNIIESFVNTFQNMAVKYFRDLKLYSLGNYHPLINIRLLPAATQITPMDQTQNISLCTPTENQDPERDNEEDKN